MVVTVYYLIWHIRCYDVDNEIIGYLIVGEMMEWIREIWSTKKRIMCNVRYITPIIYQLIFIEKILDNSNILKKSVYFNRIDSYFDLIRPQSTIFRRFLRWQQFP